MRHTTARKKSSKNAGSAGGAGPGPLMKMGIIESVPAKPPRRAPFRLVSGASSGSSALAALDALNPAKRFLDTLSPQSRRSMKANLTRVARLLGVSFEAVPWHLIRSQHIEALRAALSDTRPHQSKSRDARLSPHTVNATLAALRGVARAAYQLHAISADDYRLICEVKNVRGGRVSSRARALDLAEVSALLSACERDPTAAGARDACLVALLAGAGLRRAEAAALKLSDWRARSHTLRVRGKGDKERLVYLEDGGTRRALAAWLRVRGGEPGALLSPVDPNKGRVEIRHLTGQAVYNAVEKRRRQAGLRRRFSAHDLRHFFADWLREQGAGIEDVSELLGHASIETTAIYYHGGERAKRKAARLVKIPYGGGRRGRRRRRRRKRSKG